MPKTPMAEPIATHDFLWIRKNGTRQLVTARVGRPYPVEDGMWGCAVELEGIDGQYQDALGEGAMQALVLAVRLLRTRLGHLVDDGERLCYVQDPGVAWDRVALDQIFGT